MIFKCSVSVTDEGYEFACSFFEEQNALLISVQAIENQDMLSSIPFNMIGLSSNMSVP